MFDRRRLLTPVALLAVAAAVISCAGGVVTLLAQPLMVDLEIPLRAAARWAAGGAPYLVSSFDAGASGYDLPFLYPPPVLPPLAALAALPRPLVIVPWVLLTVGAAIWLLRRLGVPGWAIPLALAWVPFSEGLVGGNVQVVLVAGFAAVFLARPAEPWQPVTRDPAAADGRRALADGFATALIPALKISQPHAWVALLRRRPIAALAGLAVMSSIAMATLPLTGIDAWRAWLDQVARAADPGWALRGSSLVQVFPGPVALALTALSIIAVLVLPRHRLAAGAGLLLVLGVPSLRNYGVLFLLPAMLEVRRDVALVAVMLIGCGVAPLVWAGILLVAAAWLEPGRTDAVAAWARHRVNSAARR